MSSLTIGQRAGKTIKDWIPSLLLILLMLVARSTLADHYYVPSGSMEYSLMPGDHVLVNKAAYGLRIPFTKHVISLQQAPKAGDVVIFDSPVSDVRLIKRVVAVGGDEVSLHKGHLRVNGKILTKPTSSEFEVIGEQDVHLNLKNGGGPDIQGMTIPMGHVLVLGDHRGNSRDGRYFGTVAVSELYGRAVSVFWRQKDGPGWHSL